MSADKYLSIFSRQMEAIVYILVVYIIEDHCINLLYSLAGISGFILTFTFQCLNGDSLCSFSLLSIVSEICIPSCIYLIIYIFVCLFQHLIN